MLKIDMNSIAVSAFHHTDKFIISSRWVVTFDGNDFDDGSTWLAGIK